MGWSCTKAAGDVERKWSEYCRLSTGTSNVWKENGNEYFYEIERKEFEDGRIVGEIFKSSGPDGAYQVGFFRINGDGTVAKAPKVLKDIAGEK